MKHYDLHSSICFRSYHSIHYIYIVDSSEIYQVILVINGSSTSIQVELHVCLFYRCILICGLQLVMETTNAENRTLELPGLRCCCELSNFSVTNHLNARVALSVNSSFGSIFGFLRILISITSRCIQDTGLPHRKRTTTASSLLGDLEASCNFARQAYVPSVGH